MKKKNQFNPTNSDTNALDDQEILKFAEEVLSSPDDEIIGLDDDSAVTSEGDEEIIDLTDISVTELEENDILDLTEELQESEDDEENVLTLDDLTGEGANTEMAIEELDSAVDQLIVKEEIQNLDELPTPADQVEQAVIDLDSIFEDTPATDENPVQQPTEDAAKNDAPGLADDGQDVLEENLAIDLEEETSAQSAGEFVLEEANIDEDFTPEAEEDAVETNLPTSDAGDNALSTEQETQPLEPADDDRNIQEEELSLDFEDEKPQQEAETDQVNSDDLNFDDILELDDSGIGSQEKETVLDMNEDGPGASLDLSEFDDQVGEEAFDGNLPEEHRPEPSPSDSEETSGLFDDDELDDILEEQSVDLSGETTDSTPEATDEFVHDFTDESVAEMPTSPDRDAQDASEEEVLSYDDLMETENDPAGSDADEFIEDMQIDEPPELDTAAEADAVENRDDIPQDPASINFDQPDAFVQDELQDDADPFAIKVGEAAETHLKEESPLDSEFEAAPGPYPPEQLDQAVERAVRKVLSEKIDSLLADAIEQAVSKKISRLKDLILADINKAE